MSFDENYIKLRKIKFVKKLCKKSCSKKSSRKSFRRNAKLIMSRSKKPNVASLPVKRQMYLLGFLADKHPTVAGLLMFGVYPQGFLPNLCITAVIVPGTEMSSTGDVGERFMLVALPHTIKVMLLYREAHWFQKYPTAFAIPDFWASIAGSSSRNIVQGVPLSTRAFNAFFNNLKAVIQSFGFSSIA